MQHLHNQHNSTKKIFSVISAFVMSLCFIIPADSMADDSFMSDTAEPDDISSISVYDEYLSWSQLDERWGSTPMGSYNIRSVGCLITSLSIMLMDSGSIDDEAMANLGISDIEEFNPGVLANAYTRVGGFTYGGAIASWATISQLVPQVNFGGQLSFASTEKYAVADEITSLMNDGWYIIARVSNGGGYHWVYIQGVDADGNVIISDPAKDETDLYTAYPDGLQGEYWMLKGSNAPKNHVPENTVNSSDLNEYFVQNEEPVIVYSDIDSLDVTASLNAGTVVNISECEGNYGRVETSDFTGWVDMDMLAEAEKTVQTVGDINNDGNIDKYDLAVLNTYISLKEVLPDGVSTLSTAELSAADINGDGTVDSADVVAFVKLINS